MSVGTAGMLENEQKQQLSVAYVHAVAARAGYACQVFNLDDDSIDVQIAKRPCPSTSCPAFAQDRHSAQGHGTIGAQKGPSRSPLAPQEL